MRPAHRSPLLSFSTATRGLIASVAAVVVSIFAADLVFASEPAAVATQPGRSDGPRPALPAPDPTHSVQRHSTQVGWPDATAPDAPDGFVVTEFAADLESPRWLYVLPNGDVLVAQAGSHSSPDRITLLRDTNGSGHADVHKVLLKDLHQPFGMAYIAPYLYIANTDSIWRYHFRAGDEEIDDRGEKILDLPAGGYNNHWTRNIISNADKSRLLITVGSASNAGELGAGPETRRANILSINLDGSDERVVASGLRNPNGMAWEPETGALWTVVNERDNLGDNLVPDYLTRVQAGGFYGWPYSYWGHHLDPRLKPAHDEQVNKAIVPDYALGNHVAPLGLAFYTDDAFPDVYRGGAFIGEHGSWNSSTYTGFKVVFVPFENGRPSGRPRDFLTGFLPDRKSGHTYGRPVGVAVDALGALLVADDAGNRVWRVSAQ